MEIAQIRYALAAAKFLNFTKAIKTLETDLGAAFFHRAGKRVLLSNFDQRILPQLQHIFDETQVA